ncbi:hypothetical protein BDAG_03917 [Burkholderia dolosa AU0158]|nr:hypothetical protein BDAG_03917 [Burkholderia dolosa AU0158]
MSEIVQERGRNQRLVGVGLFRQRSALQRMLELRHRLPAVRDMAVLAIQPADRLYRQCHSLTPKAAKRSSNS